MTEQGLFVESSSKPWFGPRARAKKQLIQFDGLQSSQSKFIEVLLARLGQYSNNLRGIRFIKFRNRSDGFDFSIALCWVASSPASRQLIYDISQEIVSETGWYPLVAGDRLGSRAKARELPDANHVSNREAIDFTETLPDEMLSFQSAVPADGGCSIRVHLKSGASFLLDAGLPNQLTISKSDKFLLLSHVHLDHFGGILRMDSPDLIIYLSPATARVLNLRQPKWMAQNGKRIVVVNPGEFVMAGNGIRISNFAVPHCAGSSGWKIYDSTSELIYSGDISLRTSRHNFLPQLAEKFSSGSQKAKFLFLDATMAGRNFGAAENASGVLELPSDVRPLVVVSSEIDHLMYAYLDLYFQTITGDRRSQISFVMTSSVRETFAAVHNDYLADRELRIDPFIEGQFGSKRSAWGESRFLYWLDELAEPVEGKAIYFVSPRDIANPNLPSDANALKIAGRLNSDLAIPTGWDWIYGVDTSTWTSHSNSATLVESIDLMTRGGVKIILFHNFSNRLKRFVTEHNLPARFLRTSNQMLSGSDGR